MKLFYVAILLAACFQTAYSIECYSGKAYKLANDNAVTRGLVSTISSLTSSNMTSFSMKTCSDLFNGCGSALFNKTFVGVGRVNFAVATCVNTAVACNINCDGASECETSCCDGNQCNKAEIDKWLAENVSSASYTKSFIVMVVVMAVFSVYAC